MNREAAAVARASPESASLANASHQHSSLTTEATHQHQGHHEGLQAVPEMASTQQPTGDHLPDTNSTGPTASSSRRGSTASSSSGGGGNNKKGAVKVDGRSTPPPLPQGEEQNSTHHRQNDAIMAAEDANEMTVSSSDDGGSDDGIMEEDDDAEEGRGQEADHDEANMMTDATDDDAATAAAAAAATGPTGASATALTVPPSMPAHALRSAIPGPFVVLQGMPGDGMANTVDTGPVLEYHGNNSRPGSRQGSRRGSLTGAGRQGSGRVRRQQQMILAQQASSLSSSSGSSSSDNDHEGVDAMDEDLVPSPPTPSPATAEASPTRSTTSGATSTTSTTFVSAAAEVAPSASSSSGEQQQGIVNHAPPPPESPTRAARAALAAGLATEGGLHLPIPLTMGCGTLLPPLVPAPTTTGNVASATALDTDITPAEDAAAAANAALASGGAPLLVVSGGNNDNLSSSQAAPPPSASLPASPPRSRSDANTAANTTSSSSPSPASPSTTSPNPPVSRAERSAIEQWSAECRNRESRQRDDVILELNQRRVTAVAAGRTPSSSSGSGGLAGAMGAASGSNAACWWKREGRLVVFDSLPRLGQNGRNVEVVTGNVLGTLSPGCAVTAVEMVALDAETLLPTPAESSDPGGATTVQFLFIDSPIAGYVLYSLPNSYTYLGPGLPSSYADPQVWVWRVTCPDGALVREGLELTSPHVETVPYGKFVRVTRKTVNSMGLSRLRVEAVLDDDDGGGAAGGSVSASSWDGEASSPFRLGMFSSDGSSPFTPPQPRSADGRRNVVGWISESLNPLSGQRGPVVQPVPFPVPVKYRVTLPDGAVIRSDVELSSPQIGHAPLGSTLTVIGKAYSEHPTDQCVERLRLAGGGGWVSVRLNRTPPMDDPVVELVGVDGSFDLDDPGPYHLKKQREVARRLQRQNSGNSQGGGGGGGGPPSTLVTRAAARLMRTMSTAELSSINDEEEEEDDGDYPSGAPEDYGDAHGAPMPTLFRSGMGGGATTSTGGPSSGGQGAGVGHETCLICLTEERNATIVHGGTGHIACCLTCARILKARGDRCPVCRLPIDTVIQQFWA